MRNAIISSCAFCISTVLVCPRGLANPAGGSVVGGDASATIAGQGTSLVTIKQNHNRAIINWDTFSIGLGETTKFLQPSSTAAILNRVTSANPSLIYGNLEANGRVFLINPAGVLVGRSGVVNTRGFLASTFDIGDEAFRSASKLTLSGSSSASVRNEGTINALGGDVFLIANTVQNAGSIQASGTVGLAAGSRVLLAQSGAEKIAIEPSTSAGSGQGTGVDNQGQIQAATAELKAAGGNMYALAINNGGVVRATTAVTKGGHIYLEAAGGNIQNSGTLSANGTTGAGGTVVVDAGHSAANPATASSSGTIEAASAGSTGGRVEVLGDQVGLFDQAKVDVSGGTGGGTALIGGDYKGANPDVQNAQKTYVGADATISADAGQSGNGGKVIVWSDESTKFYGHISARGGAQSGDGGFAEVSGKQDLSFDGLADLSAPHGNSGTLLLDPKFIYVMNGGTNLASSWQTNAFADDPAGTNFLSPANLEAQLTNNNVTLQANTDIIFSNNVSVQPGSGNGSLTLEAGRSILFSNLVSITLQPGGAFTAVVNDANADAANRDPGRAEFWMAPNASIRAPGGINIQSGALALASDGAGGTTNVGVAANSGDFTLANLATTNLSLASAGSIFQNGVLYVTNDTALSAGKDIVLSNAANVFGGLVSVSNAQGVSLADATSLLLGGSSSTLNATAAGGDLTFAGYTTTGTGANSLVAQAGGNISQTGPLNVAGDSSFTAGPGADVLLGSSRNVLAGAVNVGAAAGALANVALRNVATNAPSPLGLDQVTNSLSVVYDNSSLQLPALNLGGALTAVSGGTLSQSGAWQVGGLAQLAATNSAANVAADIRLGGFDNQFMAPVLLRAGGDAQVRAQGNLVVGNWVSGITSNLTLVAGGDLGQTNALSVGGTSSLSAGGNIGFTNSANVFGGWVTVSNGLDVALVGATGLAVGGASSNLTAQTLAGDLILTGYLVTNNLTAVAGQNLIQTAGVSVGNLAKVSAPNGEVLLNDAANDFNVVEAVGQSVTLVDRNSITVANAVVGTDLSVTAANDIGLVDARVGRNVLLNAGGNTSVYTLANPTNFVGGTLTANAGNNATVTNSVVGSDLAVSAGLGSALVNQVTVARDATVTAGTDVTVSDLGAGRDATLGAGHNVQATRLAAGRNLSVNATNTADLTTVSVGGNATLTAQGDLTLNGVAVTTNLTATAGNDINLVDAQVGRNVTLNAGGNAAVYSSANPTNFVGGNLAVAAGTNASVASTAVGTDLSVSAVQGSAQVNHVTAGRDATVTAGTDTTVSAVEAGRDLTLGAGNNVTADQLAVARNLTVSATNTAALSAVKVGNNATVTAQNDLSLSVVAVTNNLVATATTGDLTGPGSVQVGGQTTLAAGNDITLLDPNNQFGGLVTIRNGQDVALNALGDLALSGSSATLTATGSVGTVTLAGYTANQLTATAGNGLLVNQGLNLDSGATLTADAISLNAPVRTSATGLLILQPLTPSLNLTLAGGVGGGSSYTGLNNVHAGILRVGNADNFTGNITIDQPIVLGQNTAAVYDPAVFPSQAAADTTTLSLWTHGGAITESGSAFLKVPRLTVQAGTVTLPNVNNDVYFIAGSSLSTFYVDANNAETLTTPIDTLVGLSGSFSIVKSAGQGEAADTERGFNIGVEIPIAKARLSEVELVPPDKAAYQKLVDEAIGGTESIWMSYALSWVPEVQVDKESEYRIESNSKWVAGGFTFGGSTAGPQQGR